MSDGGIEVFRRQPEVKKRSGTEARPNLVPEQRHAAALQLIARYERRLRAAARRYSLCAADADDAYQRALEILLRKAPVTEPSELLPWTLTVTKHEALAVRRNRERLLGVRSNGDEQREDDPIDLIPSDAVGPGEHAERRERITRSREALKALKPQELRALALRAQGYSYAEIGELTGWSHTKINRCMAEGRKRFFEIYASIEEGQRCQELAPILSAVCDGERQLDTEETLRAHLDSCAHCRAKMRSYRGIPGRVLELLPAAGVIGSASTAWARVAERVHSVTDQARDATVGLFTRGSETAAATAPATPRGGGSAVLAKALAITAAAGATAGGAVVTDVPDRVGGHGPKIENFAPDLGAAVDQTVGGVEELESSGQIGTATAIPAPPLAVQEFSADGGGTALGGSSASRQTGSVHDGGGGEFSP
jgi:RNA polymerase sigma factor (sigma-70 family)